ncbi:hypothetical protein MPER_03190, partial [Moniliophthora perniciosa FA553]
AVLPCRKEQKLSRQLRTALVPSKRLKHRINAWQEGTKEHWVPDRLPAAVDAAPQADEKDLIEISRKIKIKYGSSQVLVNLKLTSNPFDARGTLQDTKHIKSEGDTFKAEEEIKNEHSERYGVI